MLPFCVFCSLTETVTTSALKAAGLVEVARGSGGASIPRPLNKISFLDIYNAVECIENGELFHIHEKSNTDCPVGMDIHMVLDDKLLQVQKAMEDEFSPITMEDIMRNTRELI